VPKAGGGHRRFEEREVGEPPRVDGEVGILGRLGQRDNRGPGLEVDRLRSDKDERVTVCAQRLKGVEQRGACGDDQLSVARPTHCSPSNPTGRWPHSDCVRAP
jgi:hypothetical protein